MKDGQMDFEINYNDGSFVKNLQMEWVIKNFDGSTADSGKQGDPKKISINKDLETKGPAVRKLLIKYVDTAKNAEKVNLQFPLVFWGKKDGK